LYSQVVANYGFRKKMKRANQAQPVSYDTRIKSTAEIGMVANYRLTRHAALEVLYSLVCNRITTDCRQLSPCFDSTARYLPGEHAMEFTQLLLLANAVIVGFRHGIDWDHLAAIMDIVGTSAGPESATQRRFKTLQRESLALSTLYALGHALVVLLLGLAALMFSAILPAWVDLIMERIIGTTLLILGCWVFYSLFLHLQGNSKFELKSRWMLIFAFIQHALKKFRKTPAANAKIQVNPYGKRTAFGVGMLHGIGAETGTQVLMIAAVAGTSSRSLGISMLLCFILGLLISNTTIAILGSIGFLTSTRFKPFYVTTGLGAGVFSLVIGIIFISGFSNRLPDLQSGSNLNQHHPTN
jgi:high-affinity nickel-transport protein